MTWPDGAPVAVSVTVDVDGEAGLPGGGRGYAARLSSRSERVYGIARGLPRILALLEAFELAATFYVPGITIERHPDEIAAIAAAGHELGHHGHHHLRPDTLDPAAQAAELRDGLAAHHALTGARPTGYRAPGWELTPTTLELLAPHGFTHDSSLMGDDRPYPIAGLLELPVHWTLDDAPHFTHTTDPTALLHTWQAELRHAIDDTRHLTYTLHPDILGRPHRTDTLKHLLDDLKRTGAWTATHDQVRRHLAARPGPPDARLHCERPAGRGDGRSGPDDVHHGNLPSYPWA